MSVGWVRKDFPKSYHNGGLRLQNEEGGGGGTTRGGEMPWNAMLNSWNRSRSGVYGIRQGTMAINACTIGVLTPRCDDDDDLTA